MKSDNIPSHNHDINISATTDWGGNHIHSIPTSYDATNGGDNPQYGDSYHIAGGDNIPYRHLYPSVDSKNDGAHNHHVTIRGKSNNYGSGKSFDIDIPYIGVYMWERIG